MSSQRMPREMATLRRLRGEFRRETFLKGATSRASVKDVTWLNVGGTEMTQSEWQDGDLRSLGIWFGRRNDSAGRLLLLVNGGDSAQTFLLPGTPAEEPWICQFDTSFDSHEARSLGHALDYRLDASSVVLLEC